MIETAENPYNTENHISWPKKPLVLRLALLGMQATLILIN